MQIAAMLTMLIDHIGLVFFPGDPIWRIIGRIAFPLYAFALVVGYYRTSNVRRYLMRLFVIAIISQLPYQLALVDATLRHWEINVVAALFVCLVVLALLDLKPNLLLRLLTIAAAAVLLELFPFDYGYYGLALVLIYRYTRSHLQVLLHLALNLAVFIDKGWTVQLYSLMTTLTLVYTPHLYRAIDTLQPPRWVWRSFYPAHLAAIAAVSFLLS